MTLTNHQTFTICVYSYRHAQESSLEFEHLVIEQCENLIEAINVRRRSLVDAIRMDKETKIRHLKEQQLNATGKLQQTNGLIQFCIEALKETDSAAFLQVNVHCS